MMIVPWSEGGRRRGREGGREEGRERKGGSKGGSKTELGRKTRERARKGGSEKGRGRASECVEGYALGPGVERWGWEVGIGVGK
eukprot:3789676-Rhodomonas_salina.1